MRPGCKGNVYSPSVSSRDASLNELHGDSIQQAVGTGGLVQARSSVLICNRLFHLSQDLSP